MEIIPIGLVKSPVKEGIDENWAIIESEIIIDPEYTDGLIGLNQFSHIIVVFYMNKSSFNKTTDLKRKPQGRQDMPEVGIFSQRAKHRPNPIGITAVKLLDVKDNLLKVTGLDAIDNTPIIDIKPYFPQFDRIDSPKIPEWVDVLMKKYF